MSPFSGFPRMSLSTFANIVFMLLDSSTAFEYSKTDLHEENMEKRARDNIIDFVQVIMC